MKYARTARILLWLVIVIFVSPAPGFVFGQQGSSSDLTKMVGDSSGKSICAGDNPSCHDEKVVYHVSVSPGEADKVAIAADKIVDGKPVPMGVLKLKYDASKQTLTGEFQTARYHGWWEFTIKGNIMEGALTLL